MAIACCRPATGLLPVGCRLSRLALLAGEALRRSTALGGREGVMYVPCTLLPLLPLHMRVQLFGGEGGKMGA